MENTTYRTKISLTKRICLHDFQTSLPRFVIYDGFRCHRLSHTGFHVKWNGNAMCEGWDVWSFYLKYSMKYMPHAFDVHTHFPWEWVEKWAYDSPQSKELFSSLKATTNFEQRTTNFPGWIFHSSFCWNGVLEAFESSHVGLCTRYGFAEYQLSKIEESELWNSNW